ncbi:hypothetical protein J2W49_004037 [Hydrogenophaga palleronii]|uniref:CENP-V/GFA domain-containing protein n=1 Tax=Hydrogenophaga palleronii TaxID=65655 RepID=A0ABU1WRZ2_9BURK|nr:DUF6151 family protein [Hydrogenophaga palleronii]MDR7152061.1 hypothetical protein [Hydrogenophaga palleronii]
MSPSTHPLRCRCGTLQGHVELNGISNRMVCYCLDCQTFARFLGRPEDVLDAQGGSEVVQTAPHRIRITQGAEQLAVMRLSDQGMLRWYAACCRTPVGNTMPRPSFPFTGLLSTCLDTLPLTPSFGPVRARANTTSAAGEPKPRAFGMAGAVLRILSIVLHSRLTGRYRDTPFFTAAGAPVAQPTVLSAEARARLRPPPGND